MKKLLLAVSLFLLAAAFTGKPVNKMKQFDWLKGSWTMKTKRGTIMESWHPYNDSMMLGESIMISLTGQTKVLENLKLAYQGGTYYYISEVKGQNNEQAVKFKLTSHGESGFVAENPEHDFPKRITYERVNKDSVHAFIDGGPAMPDKKSDFYFSRMKD